MILASPTFSILIIFYVFSFFFIQVTHADVDVCDVHPVVVFSSYDAAYESKGISHSEFDRFKNDEIQRRAQDLCVSQGFIGVGEYETSAVQKSISGYSLSSENWSPTHNRLYQRRGRIYPNTVLTHCSCIEDLPDAIQCDPQVGRNLNGLDSIFYSEYRKTVRPVIKKVAPDLKLAEDLIEEKKEIKRAIQVYQRLLQSYQSRRNLTKKEKKVVQKFRSEISQLRDRLESVSDQILQKESKVARKKVNPPYSASPFSLESVADSRQSEVPVHGYSEALGFANLGNTCFANSVLHALSSVPQIEEILSQKSSPSDSFYKEKNRLKEGLLDLFQKMKTRTMELNSGQSLSKIKEGSYRSELNQIFDALEEYLRKKNGNGDPYVLTEQGEDSSGRSVRIKKYLRRHQMDADEFLRIVLDLTGYQQKVSGLTAGQRITFKSGEQRETFDTASSNTLSLPISSDRLHSVSDALRGYLSPEEMTGDNQIRNRAHVKEDSTKRTMLSHDSSQGELNQLFVQLKRFDYNPYTGQTERLKKSIDVTQDIQINVQDKTKRGQSAKVKEVQYSFYPDTVVVHFGDTPFSGHYIAYGYEPESQTWFEYDDSRVTPLKGARLKEALKLMNENSYLILYKRKK